MPFVRFAVLVFVELIVREAWRERFAVLVITGEHEPREPLSIIFLRTPSDG